MSLKFLCSICYSCGFQKYASPSRCSKELLIQRDYRSTSRHSRVYIVEFSTLTTYASTTIRFVYTFYYSCGFSHLPSSQYYGLFVRISLVVLHTWLLAFIQNPDVLLFTPIPAILANSSIPHLYITVQRHRKLGDLSSKTTEKKKKKENL